MNLKLNVYTDESLTEIKRVAEAERVKIPYRVAIYIAQSLDKVDLKNENDILNFVGGNIEKLDKIIKATFGVSETELDCVDAGELAPVAVEVYQWVIDKFNFLGGQEKNA